MSDTRLSCSWDGASMDTNRFEFSCPEDATVFHLGAQAPFCTRHFHLFDRDFGWQFPWAPEPPYNGHLISGLIEMVEKRVGVGV